MISTLRRQPSALPEAVEHRLASLDPRLPAIHVIDHPPQKAMWLGCEPHLAHFNMEFGMGPAITKPDGSAAQPLGHISDGSATTSTAQKVVDKEMLKIRAESHRYSAYAFCSRSATCCNQ